MDPYVLIKFGSKEERTDPDDGGGKKPKWTGFTFSFSHTEETILILEIWDDDVKNDDIVGQGTIKIEEILEMVEEQPKNVQLWHDENLVGSCEINLKYVPNENLIEKELDLNDAYNENGNLERDQKNGQNEIPDSLDNMLKMNQDQQQSSMQTQNDTSSLTQQGQQKNDVFQNAAGNILGGNDQKYKIQPNNVDMFYRSDYSADDNMIDVLNGIDDLLKEDQNSSIQRKNLKVNRPQSEYKLKENGFKPKKK